MHKSMLGMGHFWGRFGVTFGTLFQTPPDMVNADIRPLAFQCVARRGPVLGPKRGQKGVNSLAYTKSDHFLGGYQKVHN